MFNDNSGKKRNTSKIKRLSAYVYMPIIFASIGVIILYFALFPVIKNITAVLAMITSDGASSFSNELSDSFVGSDISGDTVDASRVDYPDANSKFAELECERLNLDVSVYSGDNEKCLRFGAGIPAYGNIPGFDKTVLISGHNATFFSPLKDVQAGDRFVLTTNYGVYTYEVSELEVKKAKDFDPAILQRADGDNLILYTCYPFSFIGGATRERLFVHCTLVSGPKVVYPEVTSK